MNYEPLTKDAILKSLRDYTSDYANLADEIAIDDTMKGHTITWREFFSSETLDCESRLLASLCDHELRGYSIVGCKFLHSWTAANLIFIHMTQTKDYQTNIDADVIEAVMKSLKKTVRFSK